MKRLFCVIRLLESVYLLMKQLLLIVLLFCLTACSEHRQQTKACQTNQSIHFSGQRLYLSTDNDQHKIYLLHNTSEQTFWLNHESGHSMSAGWGSQIKPGMWSAILLRTKRFNITCSQFSNGKTKILDCSKLIKACQMTNADLRKADAEYWLAENQDYSTLKNQLTKRGVLPK